MRLEDDVDLAEAALTRRCQGRAYLCGMMAIVVDHGYAVGSALELEAAVHAAEFFQSIAYVADWNVESKANRDGGSGIAHVVFARHVQMKLAQILAVIANMEGTGREASVGRHSRCAFQ